MSNKNKLFKLCTIILLIILSTICVFSTKVKADDLYQAVNYGGSVLPNPLAELDRTPQVLCSQQGVYLDNGFDNKYSKNGYLVTEYKEDIANYSTSDARIKYIIALTGNTNVNGGNHHSRATQRAWWALIAAGANMGTGGTGNSGWNSDNISAGMAMVQNMFNNPNMLNDIQDIVDDSTKTDSEKKSEIIDILKNIYGGYSDEEYEEDAQSYLDYKTVTYTDQQIQNFNNSIYNDTPANIIADLKSRMTGSLTEANDFASYSNSCLTDNGTKLNMDPTLNTEKLSEIAFRVGKDNNGNINSQSYAIGTLNMIYPYSPVGSSGIRFAGICGLHLKVKYSSGKVDELEYTGVNQDLTTLGDNEYTIFAQTTAGAYPASGTDFTIMVKYSEDIAQFLSFSFDYYYVTSDATAKYAYHTLYAYQYTYSKTVSRTRTTQVQDANGNWNNVYGSSTTSTKTYDPANGSARDAFSSSNFNGSSWKGYDGKTYRYSYGSLVEGKESKETSYQDLQDLSTTISSSLYINFGTCSMDFLQDGKSISIEKILEDKNGNQIDNTEGLRWNFAVLYEKGTNDVIDDNNVVNYNGTDYVKFRNDIIVDANTKSGDIELLPYYPVNYGGRAPKVLVIETDSYGKTYEQWQAGEKGKNSMWQYATPKDGTSYHVLESDQYEVTYENVKTEHHSHLAIDKKVPEDGFGGAETFNIEVKIANGVKEDTYNIYLTPETTTHIENVDFDGLTGKVITGVKNGYVYARFESDKIVWRTTSAPTYEVKEKLTDEQAQRYEVSYPGGNSGELKDCTNCANQEDPIFTLCSVVNKPEDDFKVDVDVTKIVTTEEGELSGDVTLLAKEYQISVGIVKDGDLDNLMDPQTFHITPANEELTEYNIAQYEKTFKLSNNDNSTYSVIIDEEDSEGTFFKAFQAQLKNSQESDNNNWTIVYKEDSEEIDYIIRDIDTTNKNSSFSCDVTIENQEEDNDKVTQVVLQKTFANGTPSSDTVFYFAVHANNFDLSDTRENKALFNDDVFLKDNDGNYVTAEKDGVTYERIVTVTGENFMTVSNKIDYIDDMTMDILEVDQFGEAYSENPSNETSIWKSYKPTDGVGLLTNYKFAQFNKDDVIAYESLTASIENEAITNINVLIKKRLLSFGETDVSEEVNNERLKRFFEENPDFTFKFKLYAGLNISHTTQYEDITKNSFNGVEKIEIGKSNYETGVESEDISLEKYNGKFYVVELFDSEEDKNLFIEMNGDSNDFVWYFTVPAGEKGTVEFDADNGLTKLRIDKNIEPFLDGEEFYFKVWEGDEDVTEKYFGVDTIVIDKSAHDNGGVTSEEDIYGKHTFTIIEYDDQGYTWTDRANSSSDYWDLYKPEGDGTWTYDTNSIKPDENAIKLVEVKNYYNGKIEIKKESKSENIPDSEKDKTFKATLVVTPQPDSELYVDGNLQLEPYSDTVELKIGESKTFDNISWYGNAPKYTVTEVEIPDGWKLVGFDINGTETETFTEQEMNAGKNANSVTIENEYVVSDAEILINKTIVNQKEQSVTLGKDETFYFNVYVSGKGIEYNGKEKVDYDKLTLLTTLDVTLKAGIPQNDVSTGTIKFTSNELEYKVVEVDQYKVSLEDYTNKGAKAYNSEEDYNNSYWKYYDTVGSWEGSLKNGDEERLTTIPAENQVTTVTADFTKYVIDEDRKPSEIAEGEVFKYEYEFTSNKNEENNRSGSFEITYNHQTETFETFILEKGEEISYKITEIEIPEEFEAVNYGITEGIIDGSTLRVERSGTNIRKVKDVLTIRKKVVLDKNGNNTNAFAQDEHFYFTVTTEGKQLTTDELKDLFPNHPKELIHDDKIELDYKHQSATSKVIWWVKGTNNPIYEIQEVDIPDEFKPENDGKAIVELTPHKAKEPLTEAQLVESTGEIINHSTEKVKDVLKVIKKVVLDKNGNNTNAFAQDEHFYFTVTTEGKQLTDEELKVLFPNHPEELIHDDKLELDYEHQSATSEEIIWEITEPAPVYTIQEVDIPTGYTAENGGKAVITLTPHDINEEITDAKVISIGTITNTKTHPYSADIYVLKQSTNPEGWQNEGNTYTIDVYIMRAKEDGTYQSKEEAEKITTELTYKQPSKHVKHVEWSSNEKAPKVYFEEVGYNGEKSYTINGTETTDNTIILSNGYNVKDTLRCNNGKDDEDYSGNIGVSKLVNGNKSNDVYTFRYQISRDGGNTWDSEEGYELKVKADGSLVQLPSKVTWKSTEPTPMFKIWEDNNETLESITTDEQDLEEIPGDNGKVIGYKGKFKDNAVIKFTANNGTDGTNGKVKVIKYFENVEHKNYTLQQIMQQLKEVAPNTQFYFKLTITGNFIYNGTAYTDDKPLELEKTYMIDDFSESDLQNGKDIFGEVEVEWNPNGTTPEFAVTETTSGSKFWDGEWIDNSSSSFIAGQTVTVRMTNSYTPTPVLTPYIEIGGLVWKDELETDKTELTAINGIVGDGKYDVSEDLLSNVYVVPVRIVTYANGNVETQYNHENGFLIDSSSDFYFITEYDTQNLTDGNTWHFDSVRVPAASEDEVKAGVKSVKYDIYFYYDGTKYNPTKLLEHADAYGDAYSTPADAYMNNFEDSDFFVDSMAIEGDSESAKQERSNKMSKYATVEGDLEFNSTEHTTQGKVLDSNRNETSKVDYEMDSILSETDITKYISTGEVRTLKDNTGVNPNFESDFVRATTGEAGLTYLFTDSFVEDDTEFVAEPFFANPTEVIRKVTENGVQYIYKDAYCVTYPYAKHINLGLVERPKAATTITKTIDSVTMVVNDKTATYKINNYNKEEVADGIISCIKRISENSKLYDELWSLVSGANEGNTKEFNVYTSDYYYRADTYKGTDAGDALATFYNAINGTDNGIDAINSRNLQIYLTYKLHVANASGDYDVVVNSIDDYYSSDLEFVDTVSGYNYMGGDIKDGNNNADNHSAQPGLWAYIEQGEKEETSLTNILKSKPEYYSADTSVSANEVESKDVGVSTHKKLSVNKTLKLNAQEAKDLYLTYKVVKVKEFTENLFETGVKENVAEIASFTTYLSNEQHDYKYYAGVLDSMSAPGSYNIEGAPDWMEMDTDRARIDIQAGKDEFKRTVSGTAWLDADGAKEFNGQTLGDSKLGDLSGTGDKAISGLKAQLVEIIDVPSVVDGKITDDYTEYEYYWDNAEAVTDSNGNYTIDQYAPHGIVNHGLVAGNYEVRFVYGDHNTVDNTVALNGEDYKTTAYQVDNSSTLPGYVDNEWLDFENMAEDENQARDNEARRLYLIKETQELDNNNTAIFDVAGKSKADYVAEKQSDYDQLNLEDKTYPDFGADYDYYVSKLYGNLDYDKNGSVALKENGNEIGIIKADGYAMFADTAKMNIKLERAEDKDNISGYNYDGVNIGIEERSKTNIYVDKQIKEITLTTSSDKVFFHVEYDIDYVYSETQPTTDNEYEYFRVDENLWVRLTPNGEIVGASNLQALNDVFNDNRTITQGFRYINIDSTILQGLKLDIKYQFTSFNFSETDTYGERLDNIMYDGDKEFSMEERAERFDQKIEYLAGAEYELNTANNNTLNFATTGAPKKFGEFLGHTYYQGFNANPASAWAEDKVVTTTIRKMIDYIDNDIEIDQVATTGAENGSMWDIRANSYDELGNELDDHIFVNDQVQNDSETAYKNILVTTDSKEYNSNFVKRLDPLGAGDVNNGFDTATATTVSESKVFSAQDKGNTGMDNFAEIIMIENTVGRRDEETVYGNYDPRAGAEYTTERDETSTEIVTLSPPTGNAENERNMTIAIGAIVAIAILAGGATGIKLRLSKKAKKSEEDEDKKAE